MPVNVDGTRSRAGGQIKMVPLDTTSAGTYDAIPDPGDGKRVVIVGYAFYANVANLIVTIESADGDDMLVVQVGTSNSAFVWVDSGVCSANPSEKVTLTHNTSARLTGALWYVLEAA